VKRIAARVEGPWPSLPSAVLIQEPSKKNAVFIAELTTTEKPQHCAISRRILPLSGMEDVHDAAIHGELGIIQVRFDGFCLGSFALASGTHVGCTAYRWDVPGCCRNFTPKAATSTNEIGTPLPTGLAQLSFARKVLVALPHERFPIYTKLSLGWVPPYPYPLFFGTTPTPSFVPFP
jgi:hypothetical protein